MTGAVPATARPTAVKTDPSRIKRFGRPISRVSSSKLADGGWLPLASIGMSRFAAIDVGSNALRLRVIEATAPAGPAKSRAPASASSPPLAPDSPWRDLATVRAPVRLGAEVFVSGRLTPTSIGQACDALRGFRDEMDRWKVDAYRAIATSAVREAKNGSTLIERARREAGIELEAIEGIEEARLIQLAVTRRLPLAEERALLVDVGGGSTEMTLVDHGKTTFTTSLALG